MDYRLEETSFIGHAFDLAKLQCLRRYFCKPNGLDFTGLWRPYGFEDTGTTLGMPTLNPAIEFLACVVYSVVVILIMDWSCQAVAKHAFREWRQCIHGIMLKEPRGGR